MVTHLFACTRTGYVGWRWSVTVARASRQKTVTVDEIVLIPGDEAIVAPAWVPYRERIQPGDLSPGRPAPGRATTTRGWSRRTPSATTRSTPTTRRRSATVAQDLGLGRVRTLSVGGPRRSPPSAGTTATAAPSSPLAQSAPATAARTCGFLVRIAGPLVETFGVCANGDANDDGRVVSLDHGCGAHSEVRLAKKHEPLPLPDHVFDTLDLGRGRVLLSPGRLSRPVLDGALGARRLRRRRQYSSPNSPRPKPARQVHSHQMWPSSSSRP